MPDRLLSRGALLLAGLLLAAGCNRSFDNPAEQLGAGEVAGRAVASGEGPLAGASVSIRGSALDQVTRPSGRFSVAPLPAGRHTLLLRQGVRQAQVREVQVGYGSDGQVEGLSLGDLVVPQSATVSGMVTVAGAPSDGFVVDETTGGMGFVSSGRFRMSGLPVGEHRLVASLFDASTTWVTDPVAITIGEDEGGTEKELLPIPARQASGTGMLHFRVLSLVDGLPATDAVVTVLDHDRVPQPVPAPDSNGDRDLALPEGPYHVEVRAPAGRTDIPAPPARVAIVLGSEVTDLGTFSLVDAATIDAARLSCRDDADCAPGTCQAGICAGHALALAVPPTTPICTDLPRPFCLATDDPCLVPGGDGRCKALSAVPGDYVCVPCNRSCTTDGAATLAASCP